MRRRQTSASSTTCYHSDDAVNLASIFLDSGGAAAWASVAIALLAGGLGGIWRTAVQVTRLRGELDDFRHESRRRDRKLSKVHKRVRRLANRVRALEGPRAPWTSEERQRRTGHP